MNLVLLGYRGTGKSCIAQILAKKLNRRVYSIDDLIVKSAGRPVPRIVQERGWKKFREMESKIVEEVSRIAQNGVIDCGGGVVLDERNIAHLKRNGKTALLTADIQAILKRIKNDPNRPPLKRGLSFEEEQQQILEERKELYLAAADFVCDTTHRSPKESARRIIDFFQLQPEA